MTFKIELIDETEKFKNLKKEWNSLLEKSEEKDNIFLKWEWLFNWWKIYKSKNKELFILIVKDKDKIVGIAPFFLLKYKLVSFFPSVRQIMFLGTGEVCSDFLDIITFPQLRAKIFEEIFKFLVQDVQKFSGNKFFDILLLGNIPEDSMSIPLLKKTAKKFDLNFNLFPFTECPVIELPKTVEDFKKTLNKSDRNKIFRKFRRLKENFPNYKIEKIKELSSLDEGIDVMVNLNKKRCKEKGLKSSFLSDKMVKFHKEISKIFLSKNLLDMYLFRINNKPIAYSYNFHTNGTIYGYSTGFDTNEEYCRKYNVGTILTMYVITKSIEEGFNKFSLGRGKDAYKLKFTKKIRKTLTVVIWRRKNIKGYLIKNIFLILTFLRKIALNFFPRKYVEMIKEKVLGNYFR